ncbi:MAG: beta-ketoacyl-[acyl-carrier-protein] synthase family protein [Planctomycetota bacterium]|jgi:3-oxoacyl-[acyl-carrier-protein] synthase II
MPRIVITGIGIVSPIGIGWGPFWRNALGGVSGVSEVAFSGSENLPVRFGGRVRDFEPEAHLEGLRWNRLSRVAQFAVTAAHLAGEDAGLTPEDVLPERAGVAVGIGMVGMEMVEEAVYTCRDVGPRLVKRYSAVGSYPGAGAGNISILLGFQGESQTLSTGCSSGSNAIGYAYRSLEGGEHDIMVAGGAEACLTPSTLSSLGNARILSLRNHSPRHASRPFDRYRDGYVLGEGGAMLILETWDHARRRGAPAYAEVVGYGCTSDAYNMYSVEPKGRQADRAILRAFRGTGLRPSDVDYISAHGSSSQISDRRETQVYRRTLGADAEGACISSIKSMIGHPLGACGGFQTAACALALRFSEVPPTINYEYPDPDCDLDYVPNVAREKRIKAALNVSLGLGGNNAALALKAV